MYEVFLVNLFDLTLAVKSHLAGEMEGKNLVIAFLLALLLQLSLAGHYHLSKSSFRFASTYSFGQTIVITVIMIEKALIEQHNLEQVSALFVTLAALCCSFSVLSYCQGEFFIFQTIKALYTLGRIFTHFHPPLDTLIMGSVYYFAALFSILIFARYFQGRERQQFAHKYGHMQITNLFHTLFKAFQDGIVLSKGPQLVLTNKHVLDLYGIPQNADKKSHLKSDSSNSPAKGFDQIEIGGNTIQSVRPNKVIDG